MSYQLFSATGCVRCKIIKSYMDTQKIIYEEQDIKFNGKEAFKVFYRSNRSNIFRGKDGVEFPILFTGKKIFQGVGRILAFLLAGNRLDCFVHRSEQCQGWISGLSLCAGPMADARDFLSLLKILKDHGLMIQLEADGQNARLLDTILNQRLVDRLVFYLRGTPDLYEPITGIALDADDLLHSLSLLPTPVDYQIVLPVAPVKRKTGETTYLTPDEAASAAAFLEKASHSKKHPFFIAPVDAPATLNLDPLPGPAFFKYRTRCRRYMVLSEIMKP